jgi:hypothetical protein
MRMNDSVTPAGKLILLLWHYITPRPYPEPCNFTTQWLNELTDAGLLITDPGIGGDIATERGRVHIEALLEHPLPVQRWVSP